MADRPSLQRRLRLLIGGVAVVLAVVVGGLVAVVRDFQDDVDRREGLIRAGGDAVQLAELLDDLRGSGTGDGAPAASPDEPAQRRERASSLVAQLDRRVLDEERPRARLDDLRAALLRWSPEETADADDPVLTELREASKALSSEIARSTEAAAEVAQTSRSRFLAAVAAAAATAVVLLVVGAGALRRWVLVPLRRLADDVSRVAEGDEDVELRGDASRELAQLADSVARMRDRIVAERDRAVRAVEAVDQQAPAVAALRTLLEPRHAGIPEGVRVAGALVPAEGELAGDWYDIAGDGARLVVVLGDVCGHGIEAGVLAVRTKFAILDALALGLDPASALELAARRFASEDTFVTVVVAEVDLAAGTCRWASAGHNPALLLRADGSIEELHRTGPLIGLVDGPRPNAQVAIGPGDLLVLYTDGVVEARDDAGVQMLVEGLGAVLGDQRDAEPERIVEAVSGAVLTHCGGRCTDDATVVAIRVG